MSELTPNIPLLRKAVEWAEAEAAKPAADRQWYQEDYETPAEIIGRSCGTCFCIAGWVCHTIDGEVSDQPGYRAADLLGIDPDKHHGTETGLFWDYNSIQDVRRIAEDIASEAGERL